jgi:hypothetical protein
VAFSLAARLHESALVQRLRPLVIATLLGAGCAAHGDRGAVAPPEAVYISPDLVVSCGARSSDGFEYDPVPRTVTTCRRGLASAAPVR